LRAAKAAEAVPVGLPKTEAVGVMPPRTILRLLLSNCSNPGLGTPACDGPRILPMPTEAMAVEAVQEPNVKALPKPRTKSKRQIDCSLPLSVRISRYTHALSPQELADEVGVDRETIYLWKKDGTLPWRPAGRHIKFDPAPTAEWAKRHEFLPIDQQQH
jgi:DNA-binding XRE family transcriptional regulator